jgi:tRNA-splicing ligase RtcB (3'-phosphate/5'-hydroxy nucleic acid ligase)
MREITTEKIPVKMWLEEIEDGAIEQIKNLANLPMAFKHIAIMPDSHQGYGMPIGGVLATEGVIIPNAVGVDIGCGMCAVKTSLTEIDTETLKKIMNQIRKAVPVGFNKHAEPQDMDLMPMFTTDSIVKGTDIVDEEFTKALYSLGTLGGGNHFIEIQKGNDGHIWIMIHSGSRNLGKMVADHYNKLAIELNKKWHSTVPAEWELAFLPEDSEEGQAYIREMQYCVDFALANRKLMMENICKIFTDSGVGLSNNGRVDYLSFEPMINIAHNYAKKEKHFGKEVWVHRKGATLATPDTIGIIPGSQGTKSYIVKGKGNIFSFNSCSHGAGRKMGRKQAERTLNLEEEIKMLDDQGVLHGIRGISQLDEAPGAYKDIADVMKNQEDLVEIVVELSPLGVIKG